VTSIDEADTPAEAGSGTPDYSHLEDGRTRSPWVQGHPQHYFFHDAEYGRLPDSDRPCFERVLQACLLRDFSLVDILDQRMELFDVTDQWNVDALADADDDTLFALTERGGIFADREQLAWLRDVAKACQETAKEYKSLRNYFLALPSMDATTTLLEIQARFPAFTRDDAAALMQLVGAVDDHSAHVRDGWLYSD
jgi:3-methyladenine DNA glycosylase Tag